MELDSEELKKRTKDFAHRCVKLAISLPRTTFITTRRTAQKNKKINNQQSKPEVSIWPYNALRNIPFKAPISPIC